MSIPRLMIIFAILISGAAAQNSSFNADELVISEVWSNNSANLTIDDIVMQEDGIRVFISAYGSRIDLAEANVSLEVFAWVVEGDELVRNLSHYSFSGVYAWAGPNGAGVGPLVDWPDCGMAGGVVLYEDGRPCEVVAIMPQVDKEVLSEFFADNPQFANGANNESEVWYGRAADGPGKWVRSQGYKEWCPSQDC